MNMKPHFLLRGPMLTGLALLLASCAGSLTSGSLPPGVTRAPAEPLPDSARVSKVPTPSICSSGCSQGLTKLRESWQRMLTPSEPPALPVNGATKL